MYRSLYNLNIKPFHTSSDPRFLWLGDKHKEALATLRYGILDNKGFLLLTGDVGTGKTTLINTLVNSLGDDVIVATVLDPGLSRLDFFNYIANAFGMDEYFESKGRFLVQFSTFLHKANAENKKILLIIDEAQRLDDDLLEEIRLLSNIEKQYSKLLNIFFVGQNEFNDTLHKPKNRAVRQRLTLNYNLDPLSRVETEAYITHRLRVAGTEKKIFSSKAVDEIFSCSLGFPRQINIICDLALLSGYVSENIKIGADVIRECVTDLEIPKNNQAMPIHEVGRAEDGVESDSRGGRVQATLVEQPQRRNFSAIKKTSGFLLFLTLIFLGTFAAFPQLRISTERFVSKLLTDKVTANSGSTPVMHQPDNKIIPSVSPVVAQENRAMEEKDQQDEPVILEQKNKNELPVVQPSQSSPDFPKSEQEPELNLKPDPDVAEALIDHSDIKIDELKIENTGVAKQEVSEKIDVPKPRQVPSNNVVVSSEGSVPDIVETVAAIAPVLTIPRETILIWFSMNSNDINDDQMGALANYKDLLLQDKALRIIITGYSDSVGDPAYNLKISEFRANIVKSYFLGSGVFPSQIKTRAFGEENPVASNDTLEGRQANRRVEVVFDTASGS